MCQLICLQFHFPALFLQDVAFCVFDMNGKRHMDQKLEVSDCFSFFLLLFHLYAIKLLPVTQYTSEGPMPACLTEMKKITKCITRMFLVADLTYWMGAGSGQFDLDPEIKYSMLCFHTQRVKRLDCMFVYELNSIYY